MPPTGEVIKGRAAIASTFEAWLKLGLCDWHGRIDEFSVSGETATELSTVTSAFRDAEGIVSYAPSNNLVVHRQQPDGSWLIAYDIWTAAPQES